MRRLVPFAVAAVLAALLAPGGAGALLELPSLDEPAPLAPDEVLMSFGLHEDGGALVTVTDGATGRTHIVEDTRGEIDEHDDHTHGAGEVARAAASDRCTNSTSWNYIGWGGSREARPWVAPEEVHFTDAGRPDHVGSWWRGEVIEGSDVWEVTTNPCGEPDRIGWITPEVGADSSVIIPDFDDGSGGFQSKCGDIRDHENTIGWADLHGFLAFACVTSGTSGNTKHIHEGDIVFSNASDITWCRDSGCEPGKNDIMATALHEWGHYLGLGHTCGDSDLPACDWEGPEAEAVMFPFIVGHRSLSIGDIVGAESLYPHEFGYSVSAVGVDNPADPHLLTPGHTYTVTVELENEGLRPWSEGAGPVVLATDTDAPSDFADATWVTTSRPTHLDEDISRFSDNSGRFNNDHDTVIRGETGRFVFEAAVPLDREGDITGEDFDLLADFGGGDRFASGAPVDPDLGVGTFAAALDDQVTTPVVVQGVELNETLIELENTGDVAWFVDEALTVAPSDGNGGNPCSTWVASGWPSCRTASFLDENATDLLSSIVLPGEVGRFRFTLASPIDVDLIGPQSETFEAKLDGGRFVGAPAVFDFVVL